MAFARRFVVPACALLVAAAWWSTAPAPAPVRAMAAALPADSPYMPNLTPATPGKAWSANYQTFFAHEHQAGLTWAYIFVTWSDIETTPGVFDLSGLDGLVSAAHSAGVHLMVQVQTAGDWVVPGPAQTLAEGGKRINSMNLYPPSAAPRNLDAALPLWRALVSRYSPIGSLATSSGWSDGYGVSHWEVENEPDFFPWVVDGGNWSAVAKDYALHLSHIRAALDAIDPGAQLVAPAISTGPDPSGGTPQGVEFIDSILSTDPSTLAFGSDDYRAAVAAGQPIVGAGPSIAVYSFHLDTQDPAVNYAATRSAAIRAAVTSHANQPAYPSTSAPVLWSTEGTTTGEGASATSSTAFAWSQEQFAMQVLSDGVRKLNWDLGTDGSNSSAAFATEAVGLASKAMTTYFPSPDGVASIGAQLTAAARQDVEGYAWTNPTTGLTSRAVWAQDEPMGSGSYGPTFTVQVPVSTPTALVVNSDWSTTTVAAQGGAIPVQVQRADPSPVVMVIEQQSAPLTVAEGSPGLGVAASATAIVLAARWRRRRAR